MVFGVVLHSLVEDKTFPIFYSHFFDIFGNDDMRVYREQAVASVVAKEYGFRSLCRVYSQKTRDTSSAIEIPPTGEIPSLLHSDYKMLPSRNNFNPSPQSQIQSQIASLQTRAITTLGADQEESGICMVPSGPLFHSPKKIIWKKVQSVSISIIADYYEESDMCLDFIKMFVGIVRESFSSSAWLNPQELLQRPEELTIFMQTFLPNGYLQYSSIPHKKTLRAKVEGLLN